MPREGSEYVSRQLELMTFRIGEWRKGRRSLNSVLGDLTALSGAIGSAEWNQLTADIFSRLEIALAMNIVEPNPLDTGELERDMQLIELAIAEFAKSTA